MAITGDLRVSTAVNPYKFTSLRAATHFHPSMLDNHRNQLIQFYAISLDSWNQLIQVCFVGTECLSIYSLVAGIFGMNIPYTWNDNHEYMFKWVVIVTAALCAMIFVLIIACARHKGLVGS